VYERRGDLLHSGDRLRLLRLGEDGARLPASPDR
jgi:hypothetical protein